jgi:outer membrane receptor for ferrienterochelin and colicins
MKAKITLNLMALVTGLSFYVTTIGLTPNSFAKESGLLYGIIYDSVTGQPIPDANIILLGTDYGTASQNEGYYIIQPLSKNQYDIRVKVIGYKTSTMTHIRVNENTRLDFALTPSVIQYNPVIVSATKTDHLLSQVTVSAEILDPLQIRKSNGNTAGEIIESTGSVFMKNYGSVAGLQMPSIRGSNSDQVLVVMDGQKINSAMGGGVDMNNFPMEVLEKIEVIRGGHSALWGSDAIGGIIHLFSKNSIVPNDLSYGINSTIGSFGTHGFNVYGMQNIGMLSYFVSYNRMKSDGNFE